MADHHDGYKTASDGFHMALGYCISRWADVECNLFRICLASLRAPPRQAAVIYYRTPTLDARISLVSELIQSVLPKPKDEKQHKHEDEVRWKKIENRARDLLAIRRRLAHQPHFELVGEVVRDLNDFCQRLRAHVGEPSRSHLKIKR